MKIKELLEGRQVIDDNITVRPETTKLDYEGAIVKGFFDCSQTKITSLEGAPSEVEGNFVCTDTNITSLKGSPEYIGGGFFCEHTKITSFEGGPREVGGNIIGWQTPLTSLHNIHKHIKYVGGYLLLSNKIKSHVLGVMYIKGLMKFELDSGDKKQEAVQAIINKHLKGDRDIHECQEELLEAGFRAYARL